VSPDDAEPEPELEPEPEPESGRSRTPVAHHLKDAILVVEREQAAARQFNTAGWWRRRWVELRSHTSNGMRLSYRRKPGGREMHSLDLVGSCFQDWRSPALRKSILENVSQPRPSSVEADVSIIERRGAAAQREADARQSRGEGAAPKKSKKPKKEEERPETPVSVRARRVEPTTWRLPVIMPDLSDASEETEVFLPPPQPGQPPPPGSSPPLVFTLVALEPFEGEASKTEWAQDYYSFGTDDEAELDRWKAALQLPDYRPAPPTVLLREYDPSDYDKDGDGGLSVREIGKAMRAIEKKLDEMLKGIEIRLFEHYDASHDGELDSEEVRGMLEDVQRKADKVGRKIPTVEAMMTALDKDGDGSINVEEWQERMPNKFRKALRALGAPPPPSPPTSTPPSPADSNTT
jgi:hypothetical protein